jgi:hypothetical protein
MSAEFGFQVVDASKTFETINRVLKQGILGVLEEADGQADATGRD